MESAVITGATSFIGSSLVSELLNRNVECYVVVRPESRNTEMLPQTDSRMMHIIRGDVLNPQEWTKDVPSGAIFFHFAWDGIGAEGRADKKIQMKNVQMALDCLKAAAEKGCKRFIFAGSQAEYGLQDGLITEETACDPVIEYGKGKLEVLRRAIPLSKDLDIDYVHLRIFSVYGPNDHPWTLVSRCLDAFLENREILLSSCTQMWNFLYLSDAAEAIADFGDCPLDDSPVYNIAGEETRPLKEYVEMIKEACGGGKPAYGRLGKADEPVHGIDPGIDRMKKATNWTMKTDFPSGIRKTLEIRGIKR